MPVYIEYRLDENTTVLIEGPREEGEVIKAGGSAGETVVVKAKKTFGEALKEIKGQARFLLKELEDLHVSEIEVTFGINAIGELGNMAIGKVGAGANYEVVLKWKSREEQERAITLARPRERRGEQPE